VDSNINIPKSGKKRTAISFDCGSFLPLFGGMHQNLEIKKINGAYSTFGFLVIRKLQLIHTHSRIK